MVSHSQSKTFKGAKQNKNVWHVAVSYTETTEKENTLRCVVYS